MSAALPAPKRLMAAAPQQDGAAPPSPPPRRLLPLPRAGHSRGGRPAPLSRGDASPPGARGGARLGGGGRGAGGEHGWRCRRRCRRRAGQRRGGTARRCPGAAGERPRGAENSLGEQRAASACRRPGAAVPAAANGDAGLLRERPGQEEEARPLGDRRLLQPAQVCDILKGVILVICYFMMHYVDYSMMYHLIRGQSVIKLYIIYNMLEVADRLFSSFGQDILDALYWTATEPKERKRAHIGVIPHFFMAVLYVFLHAILIMVQATTLNVAFNSHNKSLLTIMMSNNFVEIKGSVFKKFEKNNLFQMSNSDIKERFTNYVLLLIVCLRNMEQFSWNPDHLWVLFPDVCMVVASEIAVDIVKHAFITKFNDITADVYSEYRASLAFDLVSSRQKNAYTDYSDSVSRRMGFIPLPLAVLLIRVVTSSIKVQGILAYVCVVLFYCGLISLKVLNSIVLLGKSCQYVKEAKMEEKLFNPVLTATPGKPAGKQQSMFKSTQGISTDENGSTSVTSQPVHQKENTPSLLVTSNSDQFLTTPDGEEKDISQDSSELKHRSAKKDLLEIDRFTICGNRID
ncbi:transmembrane anterior posterior transformation protein 1 homolog isoform 3-T3 [Alca torda]